MLAKTRTYIESVELPRVFGCILDYNLAIIFYGKLVIKIEIIVLSSNL